MQGDLDRPVRGARRGRRLRALAAVAATGLLGVVAVSAVAGGGLRHGLRAPLRRVTELADHFAGPRTRRWAAGSGGPAGAIALFDPSGLAEAPDGSLYFSDRGHGKARGLRVGGFLWRLHPDGHAEVVAGTGLRGVPRDGQRALDADLGAPAGLTVDARGRVYFADPANHVVLCLERDGTLTRVAGTGEPGGGGDGGPATAAQLDQPFDVALDRAGQLYVADHANHRVRRVAPDGRIETVAGTGRPGYAGDGGPAASARLNGVYGVQVHPDGRLLIADTFNHVVRQVDPEGTISTLAGSGREGGAGDGGPARLAEFCAPESLFVDAAGRIYVGDESDHTVRVIDTDGRIHRVAGDGAPGFARSGQPASSSPLNDPESELVRSDGSIVVCDGDTGRLLEVGRDGTLSVLAGHAERTLDEALRLFRVRNPEARAAYERRLRTAETARPSDPERRDALP